MHARTSLRLFATLAAAVLTACGPGGHTASVSQLFPDITYPPTSGLVVGAPMTPLRPMVSSHVSGFSVDPPLPAGLKIEPTNGAIFGTPTAVAPTRIYTVEATSNGTRVTTTVSLTVRDVVPQISYATTSWDLVQNAPIACIVPTVSGGTIVTWSIDHGLPAGLLFDTGNGQICGTPTDAAPRANYIVTAENSGGSSSATLSIAVLATSSSGGATLRAGARALSLDSSGHGMLWNVGSGTSLATFDGVVDSYGRASCALGAAHCLKFLALAGDTAVVWSGHRLIVLDSASGARRSQLMVPGTIRWWRLAIDGSYVATATDAQLIVWSPTGEILFSTVADYGDAIVAATAGELRIGAGAAGPQVIETIVLPAGIRRVSAPFPGTFGSWSEDGDRFVAIAHGAARVYSHDAAPFTLDAEDRHAAPAL